MAKSSFKLEHPLGSGLFYWSYSFFVSDLHEFALFDLGFRCFYAYLYKISG